MEERYMAFGGTVDLLGWSETSKAGLSVKLGLCEGRPALSHFDDVTKRSSRRSGQRYMLSLVKPERTVSFEVWFMGANWSHQGGASIRLMVSDDDAHILKALPTKDATTIGYSFVAAMVQIDDDEKPVDQERASKEVVVLKGGPKSIAVARKCGEPEFQDYVAHVTGQEHCSRDQCDDFIKRRLGFESKRMMDHDDELFRRWEDKIHAPYVRWLHAQA